MKKHEVFKDFFVFSLVIFILLYLILIIVNMMYVERTVEEIVDRSSVSVVNIINDYNARYINFSQIFSNDIRINSYVKSLIIFSSGNHVSNNIIFNNTYNRLDEYINEKKDVVLFNGKIIISDFSGNIIYPKKINFLNYTIFENNLKELENSTNLIKSSPVFSFNNENYFYLTTFIFDIDQIPIAYISFEIKVKFNHLKSFSTDDIKFYIVDNRTKLIWPKVSLPYFIYSKIFLSKEKIKKFYFNGKLYTINKTDFGDSVYVLSIFESKNLSKFSIVFFSMITFFFSGILIFWMRRYFKHENNISKELFRISYNLGIEDKNLIKTSIKKLKHINKVIFRDVETFEDIENNIIDAIRVYEDIIYISFYKKRINEIDYFSYNIYVSENYNITKEYLEILKTTKEFYIYSFGKRILDFDGFLLIKEEKFSDLEKDLFFNGVKYMLNNLYIKINDIRDIDEFKKMFFEKKFKNVLIAKFTESTISLKNIDIYKSNVFKYKNNLIFLNTFRYNLNQEIIEYIEVLSEFENKHVKFINFQIPKYSSKRKKLLKEIEKILDMKWENVESSYW
ncbi:MULTISPECIES: hypothetical protein [unclassified Marinitoga]|uniref:hypothetical protein n=1 Tax=unclassified Marinitoga TaxID=2640159 RepID=UPI0006416A05|nr:MULTISPECIES: hypothetical protein [unclassified Marinitoga]KLO23974.1 hypothetical protein X274_05425 [Marinitoga sp. 1155]NUU99147.1 hypothetical protein [Marinitoga sp. 1154]